MCQAGNLVVNNSISYSVTSPGIPFDITLATTRFSGHGVIFVALWLLTSPIADDIKNRPSFTFSGMVRATIILYHTVTRAVELHEWDRAFGIAG